MVACATCCSTYGDMPQVLTQRFREAPRCDVYVKLQAGVMKLAKVPQAGPTCVGLGCTFTEDG